ncbi:MAG: hypothetical protein WCO86_17865 [Planctomycetota bacterium]
MRRGTYRGQTLHSRVPSLQSMSSMAYRDRQGGGRSALTNMREEGLGRTCFQEAYFYLRGWDGQDKATSLL